MIEEGRYSRRKSIRILFLDFSSEREAMCNEPIIREPQLSPTEGEFLQSEMPISKNTAFFPMAYGLNVEHEKSFRIRQSAFLQGHQFDEIECILRIFQYTSSAQKQRSLRDILPRKVWTRFGSLAVNDCGRMIIHKHSVRKVPQRQY